MCNIAVTEHGIDIALSVLLVRAEIAAVVRADGTLRLPVVLRVDEHGVIERGAEIEHRLEHVVLDLYELHRLIDARLIPPGENGDNVARKADVAGVLRHVLPRKHGFHARHAHGSLRVDLAHHGVCVRRAQKFYYKTVSRRDVLGIDWLPGHKLHGVQLAHALIDGVHSSLASFAFFHARKLCMPRSCPS